MAAPSGKKGKKTKGTTLSIGEFLGAKAHGSSDGTTLVTVPKNVRDWSEDVPEDSYDDGGYSASTRVALPTAPRASRESAVDLSQVPDKPPFTAFVGNLSYDIDEEGLAEFFSKLSVSSVRLPKDQGRFRGFGYVEFSTKQDLIEALGLDDEDFMGRKVRVNLVGPSSYNSEGRDNNRRGFGSRRDDDDFERPADTESNWRSSSSAVPERRNEGSDRRGYNDSYRRDNDDGRSGPRFDTTDGPGWRNGAEPRADSDAGPRREHDDGPRRGFDDGPRRGGYDDGPRRGNDDQGREEPKERPKLQLQPRTKAAEPGQPTVSSSVFGAAKPVDTAAREREVEQKLRLQEEKERSELSSRSRAFGARRDGDGGGFDRERGHTSGLRDEAFGSSDSDRGKGPSVPYAAAAHRRRNNEDAELEAGRSAASGARIEGESDRASKGKLARPPPTSIDDMPKLEPAKNKDFSDSNKFAGLHDDSSGEEIGE